MHTLAILGAGTVGRGIAQLAARGGLEVVLVDPSLPALESARRTLNEGLAAEERAGRLRSPLELIQRRLHFQQEPNGLAGADWVIEAAPERLELKCALLAQADILAPGALLATTTSSLSVTRLGAATSRPGDVVGLHFPHPAPAAALVEVVSGLDTRAGVIEEATALVTRLGRTPLTTRDRPGFIVERVLQAMTSEALTLAGEGVAIATIDAIARGMGLPLGPFERLDLIGLDAALETSERLYRALYQPPRLRPHPLLRQMVHAGRSGLAGGRGFYDYRQSHDMTPGTPKAPPEPPQVLVIGGTPSADELRDRFATVERPSDADLILDARIGSDEKGQARLSEPLPAATLTWGHSASAVTRGYRRSVVGFGLVPPIGERSVVELYPPLSGRDEALALTRTFFEANGLATVTLHDRPGGVGFRLLAALIDEAATAVAEGAGPPDQIDRAMKLGAALPYGPLEWSERLGLRPLLSALEGLHAELGEARTRPHPLLRRMVAAGVEGWR
jgi:3-hydroxybutyryl-CoA dehydrogenase